MKKYDTTFVIDGKLGVDDREDLIEKFRSSLEKLGGNIDRIVRWGIRTLAYEIKKRYRGYYVIFYYTADPSIIKPFERELGINENVLRHMTLIFDGKHPSYIVDEGIQSSESSYDVPKEPVPEIPEVFEETNERADDLGEEVLENDVESDSIEEIKADDLGEVVLENDVESDSIEEIKADKLLDEVPDEEENESVSDSKPVDGETENIIDKEDE